MAVATPAAPGSACTVWRPVRPVDVGRTLRPLRRGAGDPTFVVDASGLWRTTSLPSGPATVHVAQRGLHEVHGTAWGPGAAEAIETLPDLLGAKDDCSAFEPRHPLLVDAHRRHPGVRVPRTGRVFEALLPAVLEQKVTGKEAFAAFRTLVRRFGSPAPGPAPEGMVVPPDAATWRLVPSWEWHRAGVDPKRMRTALACAQVAPRLEECTGMSAADAERRLRAVPGVGLWTYAEVGQRALGDADALSVGDYHLAAYVGWALLGRPLDDAGLVELLEDWRPHRHRVVLLIGASGFTKPRFGPRMTVQDHRRI